jgi:hypothetical protein
MKKLSGKTIVVSGGGLRPKGLWNVFGDSMGE